MKQNSNKKVQIIELQSGSCLTGELINKLEELFEFVPPEQLTKSLREVFFTYLIKEKEMLPPDFERVVTDLYFLFNFLDGEN